jgi:hypothetical protein
MKHGREDYNRIQDPAGLIPEDEPVFLLRGQDRLAPDVLRHWAHQLLESGGDGKMAQMAMQQANDMLVWQAKHKRKLPDLLKEQ